MSFLPSKLSDTQWRSSHWQSREVTPIICLRMQALWRQTRADRACTLQPESRDTTRAGPAIKLLGEGKQTPQKPLPMLLLFSLVLKAWIMSVCLHVCVSVCYHISEEMSTGNSNKNTILFHIVRYVNFTSRSLCEKSRIQTSGFAITLRALSC